MLRESLSAATLCAVVVLSGCAVGRHTPGPEAKLEAATPASWPGAVPAGAVLAHDGRPEHLADWWSRLNDPALDALLLAAQKESGTLARAVAAIERSRADAVAAGVAGWPTLDAVASVNRAALSFGGPAVLRTQSQWGVQSSWEIDLFGALARQREAAEAQLRADVAQWHVARVSLAAETATAYANFRFCEIQAAHAEESARSFTESARLVDIAGRAGLQSGAAVAIARAAAAEAAGTLAQRRAQCEVALKGLVALTAMSEAPLRDLLGRNRARIPAPAPFRIAAIPAHALAQRPDIAAAERRVAAASAEIGQAEANRYPRLSLAGNILPTRMQMGTSPPISFTSWSIGPSLLAPLFDGGRREANVAAARAQYVAAAAEFRSLARRAVSEVEEALVNLVAVEARQREAERVSAGLRVNLEAAGQRLKAGLAGGAEVEDARRQSMGADLALASLVLERLAAWVSLYRAVGGGWEPDASEPMRRVNSQ